MYPSTSYPWSTRKCFHAHDIHGKLGTQWFVKYTETVAELNSLFYWDLCPYPDYSSIIFPELCLLGPTAYHDTKGHGLFSKCEVHRWSLKNHGNVTDAISNVLEPIQALQYFLPGFFAHGRSLQELHQISLVFCWNQRVSQEKSYSLSNWNQTHIFLSRAILSHSLLSFFLSKAKSLWYSEILRTKWKRRTPGYCSYCSCSHTWYLEKDLLKNNSTMLQVRRRKK